MRSLIFGMRLTTCQRNVNNDRICDTIHALVHNIIIATIGVATAGRCFSVLHLIVVDVPMTSGAIARWLCDSR